MDYDKLIAELGKREQFYKDTNSIEEAEFMYRTAAAIRELTAKLKACEERLGFIKHNPSLHWYVSGDRDGVKKVSIGSWHGQYEPHFESYCGISDSETFEECLDKAISARLAALKGGKHE